MTDHEAAGQNPGGEGQEPSDALPQDQESGEQWEPERALKTIAKLRGFEKQAKQLEQRLKEYEAREREAEDAKLSESQRLAKDVERLTAERDAARRERQEAMNRQQVLIHAQRLGAHDPDVVAQLLPWAEIDHAADGTAQNLEKHIRQLLKDKPYLAAAPGSPPMSVGNGATRQPQPGQKVWTRAEIADYATYQRNRDDIVQAFREGRVADD